MNPFLSALFCTIGNIPHVMGQKGLNILNIQLSIVLVDALCTIVIRGLPFLWLAMKALVVDWDLELSSMIYVGSNALRLDLGFEIRDWVR
jgi:hypothetical protein